MRAEPPAPAPPSSPRARAPLAVERLGVVPYDEAARLQEHLVALRQADRIADRLLLLEHPPVITVGVAARESRRNILATADELARRGVEVRAARRGGDVTYHGPGQLVGYPVLRLAPERRDVHRYVRDLEEVLIRAAAHFGVQAGREPGLTGVWVGPDKLAAIGVRFSRWVTSHGFALNVAADLAPFRLSRPCGIDGRGVTSLAALTGRAASVDEVAAVVGHCFAAVFERDLQELRCNATQELAPQNANGVRAAVQAPGTVGAGADPEPATGWRR